MSNRTGHLQASETGARWCWKGSQANSAGVRGLQGSLGKGIAANRGTPRSSGVDVITVCSRCKKIISETSEQGSERKVSHGICSGCLAILEGQILEGTKAVDSHLKEKTETLHAEDA